MATHLFYPPQVMEPWPWIRDGFFDRMPQARGIAILVKNGVAERWRVVVDDDVADYQYVYLGGHIHSVDATAASVLTAAGFPTKTAEEAVALNNTEHDGFLVAL